MKPSEFKKQSQFFHLNMEFEVSGYFKELDWIRLQKELAVQAQIHKIDIQALVMMDTHFHVLIESYAQKENFFSDAVATKINLLKKLNSDCEPIENVTQYLNSYKYIYNNPVRAGLSKDVQSYPFSSLPGLLGLRPSYCLVSDKMRLIQNPHHVLKWLNAVEGTNSTTAATDYKVSRLSNQFFH